jgi:hypothetical protein
MPNADKTWPRCSAVNCGGRSSSVGSPAMTWWSWVRVVVVKHGETWSNMVKPWRILKYLKINWSKPSDCCSNKQRGSSNGVRSLSLEPKQDYANFTGICCGMTKTQMGSNGDTRSTIETLKLPSLSLLRTLKTWSMVNLCYQEQSWSKSWCLTHARKHIANFLRVICCDQAILSRTWVEKASRVGFALA